MEQSKIIDTLERYHDRCVTNLKHEVLFDWLPYEWRSGTSDGLFLPIYPPRSMRIILGF